VYKIIDYLGSFPTKKGIKKLLEFVILEETDNGKSAKQFLSFVKDSDKKIHIRGLRTEFANWLNT
ncbi:hypothetical protein BpHYR1_039469, partial [Brachionus plicatilis]